MSKSGHDTITDFSSHLTDAGHDTIQFAVSQFANFAAMYAATADTVSGAQITAGNGDVLFLSGVTRTQIAANSSDFSFV